jgi:uncharacterized protein YggE
MRTLLQGLALIFLASISALAQQKPLERPWISVDGEAEIYVKPDRMTFAFGIDSVDKNVMTARSMNEDRAKKVFEAINKFGVPAKDIQTSYLSIEEEYTQVAYNSARQFVGYRVARRIIVTTEDMDHAEDLVAAVVNAGVNDIGGINLERSDYPKFREQARAQAVEAAQHKAELMTKALGQSIGKAFYIEELSVPDFQTAYRSMNSNSVGYSSLARIENESGPTIAPGQIRIIARVRINFVLN